MPFKNASTIQNWNFHIILFMKFIKGNLQKNVTRKALVSQTFFIGKPCCEHALILHTLQWHILEVSPGDDKVYEGEIKKQAVGKINIHVWNM